MGLPICIPTQERGNERHTGDLNLFVGWVEQCETHQFQLLEQASQSLLSQGITPTPIDFSE